MVQNTLNINTTCKTILRRNTVKVFTYWKRMLGKLHNTVCNSVKICICLFNCVTITSALKKIKPVVWIIIYFQIYFIIFGNEIYLQWRKILKNKIIYTLDLIFTFCFIYNIQTHTHSYTPKITFAQYTIK